MNYEIKYQTNEGTLIARIFQPLAYTNSPAEVKSVAMNQAKEYVGSGANALLSAAGVMIVSIGAAAMWAGEKWSNLEIWSDIILLTKISLNF